MASPLSPKRRTAVLLTLCLAAFTINLDTTIVNVALPTLVRDLGASTRQLQWIVDAYALVFAGLGLSTAAIAALVFTIIEAPEVGWAAGRSLAGFGAAAVLFAVFVGWEQRAEQPMLDVGLFRNLRFSAASGSVTVAFFALFGFVFMVTQYFQFFKAYSPFGTGIRLLPVAVSVAIASILATRLAVRVG